jgi:hypothetical protein
MQQSTCSFLLALALSLHRATTLLTLSATLAAALVMPPAILAIRLHPASKKLLPRPVTIESAWFRALRILPAKAPSARVMPPVRLSAKRTPLATRPLIQFLMLSKALS